MHAYFERKYSGPAQVWLMEDRLGRAPYDLADPVIVVGAGKAQELSRRSKIVRDIATQTLHARYYVPAEDLAPLQALLRKQ